MPYPDISKEIAELAKSYQSTGAPPWLLRVQEALQHFYRWLQELFDELVRHRGPGASDTRGLSTLIQYLLYIAGAIAVIVLIFALWKNFAAKKRQASVLRKGADSVETILSFQGYKNEAARLAQAADYKGACRSLYLSLLQVLHENSVANFAPAKTNFEYRYLLAKHQPILSRFIPFAELVEQICFGHRQASIQDYEYCLSELEQVEKEALQAAMELQRLKAEQEAQLI